MFQRFIGYLRLQYALQCCIGDQYGSDSVQCDTLKIKAGCQKHCSYLNVAFMLRATLAQVNCFHAKNSFTGSQIKQKILSHTPWCKLIQDKFLRNAPSLLLNVAEPLESAQLATGPATPIHLVSKNKIMRLDFAQAAVAIGDVSREKKKSTSVN